jgi:hypothetical protein
MGALLAASIVSLLPKKRKDVELVMIHTLVVTALAIEPLERLMNVQKIIQV